MAVEAEAIDCLGVSEPVRTSSGEGEAEGLFVLSLLGGDAVSGALK